MYNSEREKISASQRKQHKDHNYYSRRLPSAGAGPRWPCSSRPHHGRRPSTLVATAGRPSPGTHAASRRARARRPARSSWHSRSTSTPRPGGPTRQKVRSRDKTQGPRILEARQRARSWPGARSSTGMNPTGPGVQSSGESSGPVKIGAGTVVGEIGARRGRRCSRGANWALDEVLAAAAVRSRP